MKKWNQRSIIDASILNPAFCSILLYCTIKEHNNASNKPGFDYPLIYIVLPLLLSTKTLETFPKTIATKLLNWCIVNEHLLIEFPNRVKELKEYTNEALMFSISRKHIILNSDGSLEANPSISFRKVPLSPENKFLMKQARFLGKWLHRAGDTATIFSLLKLRP